MLNRDSARKRVKTPPLLSHTTRTRQSRDHLLHVQHHRTLVRDNKVVYHLTKLLYSLRRKTRNLRKPCGANHHHITHLQKKTANKLPQYHLTTKTVGHGYRLRHHLHLSRTTYSPYHHTATTGYNLNSIGNFLSSKRTYPLSW